MVEANIKKDMSGRIIVSFYYDPLLVANIKTIEGRRWHPAEKHWSFPNRDDMLEKILKVFGDKEVQIDSVLQSTLPKDSSADDKAKQEQSQFEDLRREFVSRKYSYKTVKGYIYYNGDFLGFTGKEPSEVNDDDIEDYLLYLAEERESATATINQAIPLKDQKKVSPCTFCTNIPPALIAVPARRQGRSAHAAGRFGNRS